VIPNRNIDGKRTGKLCRGYAYMKLKSREEQQPDLHTAEAGGRHGPRRHFIDIENSDDIMETEQKEGKEQPKTTEERMEELKKEKAVLQEKKEMQIMKKEVWELKKDTSEIYKILKILGLGFTRMGKGIVKIITYFANRPSTPGKHTKKSDLFDPPDYDKVFGTDKRKRGGHEIGI